MAKKTFRWASLFCLVLLAACSTTRPGSVVQDSPHLYLLHVAAQDSSINSALLMLRAAINEGYDQSLVQTMMWVSIVESGNLRYVYDIDAVCLLIEPGEVTVKGRSCR